MSTGSKQREGWRQSGAWALMMSALPLLALLLFFIVLGWHSRYIADDFCTAGWLKARGFWGSQAYWRNEWSGRFSFFFIMNLLHLLGSAVARLLPALMLGAWCLSLFGVAKLIRVDGQQPLFLGLLLAILAPAASLATTPNLYQSFLWQTGLVTYVLPLVLVSALAYWILRSQSAPDEAGVHWRLVVSGILTLVTGGLSETMAAVQLVLLALVLALFALLPEIRQRFQESVRQLMAASAGAAVAVVLVVTAPGNLVRQEIVGGPSPILRALADSFYNTYIFSARLFRHEIGWLLLVFGLSVAVGCLWRPHRYEEPTAVRGYIGRYITFLILVPILTAVLVLATMAPSAYAMNSFPDGRVLVMAHYWVVIGIMIWGGVIGSFAAIGLPAKSIKPIAISSGLIAFGLACFLAVSSIRGNQMLLGDAQEFARSWDQRNEQLLMEDDSIETVAAASLSHMGGLDELARDSNYWVNRCLAMTYELQSVVAK